MDTGYSADMAIPGGEFDGYAPPPAWAKTAFDYFLLAMILAVVAFGGFMFYKSRQNKKQE